jgi:hypothetical protein
MDPNQNSGKPFPGKVRLLSPSHVELTFSLCLAPQQTTTTYSLYFMAGLSTSHTKMIGKSSLPIYANIFSMIGTKVGFIIIGIL